MKEVMAKKKTIRVLLAEDHHLVREGFRQILESEADIEIVGEADDGRAAVQTARQMRPHVVLMDLSMPELNGMEATRQISEMRDAPKVLCLSMHKERAMIASALRAGAQGYLLKNCLPAELKGAVRAVASGGTFISPAVAGDLVDGFIRNNLEPKDSVITKLTPREREVLQLIAEGLSSKEIASRLGVVQNTVLAHRQHIMDKLGLHSDVELARYAIREGLTDL